jgi:predicted transcriptional regulator
MMAKTDFKIPRKRSARTLDRDKAEALYKDGKSTHEIADRLGVNQSTVQRYLNKTKPELEALEAYKKHRADIFADLQAKGIELQHRILDSLLQDLGALDGVSTALTVHQKINLISVLNAQFGTIFDKERLQRGESTSNVSIIHKMMGDAFISSHKEADLPSKSRTPKLGAGVSGVDEASEPAEAALLPAPSAVEAGGTPGRGEYPLVEAGTGSAQVDSETKTKE